MLPITKRSEENRDRLLSELIKDSSRSDRQLGIALKLSQPTVSRLKKNLIANDLIKGFTVIPNFFSMGFKLMALTFVKTKSFISEDEARERKRFVKEWIMNQSCVFFSADCRGLNMDGVMGSIHRNYEEYDEFRERHNQQLGH